MPTGLFNHSVDAKGRVFIPAKFRPDLGTRFTLFKCPTDTCLRAYNEENWKKYKKKLAKIKDKNNRLRRLIFSSSYEVETDSQGRILIPADLLEESHIRDKAVIIGMDRWVEIWDPAEHRSAMDPDDNETLSEIMTSLDSDDDDEDDDF